MGVFCLRLRDTEGRERLVSINLLAAVVYGESIKTRPRTAYSFHAGTFAIAFILPRPRLHSCGLALRRNASHIFRVARLSLED